MLTNKTLQASQTFSQYAHVADNSLPLATVNGRTVKSHSPTLTIKRCADLYGPESRLTVSNLPAVKRSEAKNQVYNRGWLKDRKIDNYSELLHSPSQNQQRQQMLSKNLVYQYCEPADKRKWTNLKDLTDAIRIGLSTLKEYIVSKFTRSDPFFLTPWYKPEVLKKDEPSVATLKLGEFQHHGHAHVSICLQGDDGQPLTLTFDPATSSMGPYEAKEKPILNRKADLVLISHGHMDHTCNVSDVTRPQKNILTRLTSLVRRTVPFLRSSQVANLEHTHHAKVLMPTGTSKMVPHLRFLEKQGDAVEAFPYDPCVIQRDGHDSATVIPILSKHWAGTSPFNAHKAPALGYLIITQGQTVFFAGDTAFDQDMYETVSQIAEQFRTTVDLVLFPAGPDHKRHQMEKTHQATIDGINTQIITQTLPVYRKLKATRNQDSAIAQASASDINIIHSLNRQQRIELLKNSAVYKMHSEHYKLGNIHAEDALICLIDLISYYNYGNSTYLESNSHLNHLPEENRTLERAALDRVRSDMNSTAYKNCRLQVISLLNRQIPERNTALSLLLHQLLTQAPSGYVRPLDGSDNHHWIDALVDMVDNNTFDITRLSLKAMQAWYKTPPAERTSEQLVRLFGKPT